MAEKLASNNIKVVAVGRRKQNLDDFVANKPSEIPGFVAEVTAAYPDLDRVWFNFGI
jgi:NADP-dependent 3-hydroxy acid dehydrogenase YdfG